MDLPCWFARTATLPGLDYQRTVPAGRRASPGGQASNLDHSMFVLSDP
jgi:hypothetical protein